MAEGRVVGIDLGTTNSLVAFMEGDQPVVIPGEDGDRLVPSVVAWTDDGIAVGHAPRPTLLTDSANAVYSAKRLMGRDIADVQEDLKLFPFKLVDGLQPGEVLKLNVGGLALTPPEISAYILLQLKKNAERFFGASVTKAVIAVYDFGGGTFDISILKLHEGIFEVIATNGDTHLGGDDIDNLLIAIALDDIAGDYGLDLRGHAESIQTIRKAVIEAKIALSSQLSARIEIELPQGRRY